MNIDETIKNIRVDLRTSMDGIVSQSMREKGLGYKMNFGVRIMRLQQMADQYEKSVDLAEKLWEQETRELKILATLLYPIEAFDQDTAQRWGETIPNQEIREQLSKNIFQELSFADQLVQQWIAAEDEEVRTTGYWLLARLIISKSPLVEQCNLSQLINNAIVDATGDDYFLRNAAHSALRFMGRVNSELVDKIMSAVEPFAASDNDLEKELYESLSFEFDR